MKAIVLPLTLAVASAYSGTAFAQAEIVPEDEIKGAGDADIEGWNPSLALSGTLNLVSNTNVVGQVEGLSMLFGLGVVGGADYIKGKSVIRNEFTISESFAKTPVVDDFVKTDDKISIASSYNYFITKSFGSFAQLKVETSLFDSTAVTAEVQNYSVASAKPNGMSQSVMTDRLEVASAFKPFTLSESIGLFAEPVSSDLVNLSLRGGLGGRHTFASGVLVENDDSLTPNVIELQELADVHQAGVELYVGLKGKAEEDRIAYTVGASLLMPFVNNDDFNRSASELTRLALEGSVTVSVFDWMGLVYKGSIIADPQLFPDGSELTQYQTSLLLTFNYTLIDREKGIEEMKKEAAIEKAKHEKEEAIKKAEAAEARAVELEKQIEEAKQRELEAEQERAAEAAAAEAAAMEGGGVEDGATGGIEGGVEGGVTP